MTQPQKDFCPECKDDSQVQPGVGRRQFIRTVGTGVAVLAGSGSGLLRKATAAESPKRPARPAEELVRELYSTLTPQQKQELVLPWDHGADNGLATRLGMYNRPIAGKRIGEHYTAAQQELIERILRASASDEDGYQQISRNGTFDGSGSLQGCGALLFGEPVDDQKFVWVFTGHHLTVRCDGNYSDGVAFGGPMYYGHSPNGYSDRNVFNYQTKAVLSVYDALDEEQRQQAEVVGSPGEHAPSVEFREPGQAKPGVAFADLTPDQRELVETVMRTVLSPYRNEDADEVMQIVKANGGMEGIHLAFYKDGRAGDNARWHFWRLEGRGFVWNYRVLPHVHTYVNIAARA